MTPRATDHLPPRIALLTEFLRLGGSTTFLCNLAGELVRRQIPVRVDSFENSHPLSEDFEAQGITVSTSDERSLIFEDRLARLIDQLHKFQPTILVATIGTMAFETLRYAPSGTLRIGMAHSDSPEVYDRVRRYGQWVDAMVGVSRKICENLRETKEFTNIPVHHIPCGVPFSIKVNRKQRATSAPLRILYLGRLDQEQKRVRLLPGIRQNLAASGVPTEWTIAGDGPERLYLENQLLSISDGCKVTFTGAVSYRQVPALLENHDVYLLTSDYEGLPLILIRCQDETNSGRVAAWQDPAGLIHSS